MLGSDFRVFIILRKAVSPSVMAGSGAPLTLWVKHFYSKDPRTLFSWSFSLSASPFPAVMMASIKQTHTRGNGGGNAATTHRSTITMDHWLGFGNIFIPVSGSLKTNKWGVSDLPLRVLRVRVHPTKGSFPIPPPQVMLPLWLFPGPKVDNTVSKPKVYPTM